MAIIVFQHWDLGRAGRLGVTLRDNGFPLDTRRLHKGDAIPADYDDVDAVISLGGPQNIGEDHPWMADEMKYLAGAHERSLPVVGVCLGHQLIAAAIGGKVTKAAKPEMGLVDVNITPAGQTDPVLAGIAWKSPQFQSHSFEVSEAPGGSTVLAGSAACKVQAMRVGMRTYGFQYHFEVDRELANEYMSSEDAASLSAAGVTMDDYRQSMDRKYEMFARLADRLCLNIATYLVPRLANKA